MKIFDLDIHGRIPELIVEKYVLLLDEDKEFIKKQLIQDFDSLFCALDILKDRFSMSKKEFLKYTKKSVGTPETQKSSERCFELAKKTVEDYLKIDKKVNENTTKTKIEWNDEKT